MATYQSNIKWQAQWGGPIEQVRSAFRESWEEANREALELARARGWTPPQWWQFWRWSEPKVELEEPPTPGEPRA